MHTDPVGLAQSDCCCLRPLWEGDDGQEHSIVGMAECFVYPVQPAFKLELGLSRSHNLKNVIARHSFQGFLHFVSVTVNVVFKFTSLALVLFPAGLSVWKEKLVCQIYKIYK